MHALVYDPWYCHRQVFTKKIIASLAGGLVEDIVLFAPRRMGKTQFILRDLIPAHRESGGDAIYINPSKNKSSPERVIIEALRIHLEVLKIETADNSENASKTIGLKLRKFCRAFGDDLRLKPYSETVAVALQLWAYWLRLNNQFGLFVIDGLEYLNSSDDHDQFVSSLRTGLKSVADCIKPIFTISTHAGLAKSYYENSASFYGAGNQVNLPQLGNEFIEFISKKVGETYKRKFLKEDIVETFEQHDSSPYFLRQALNYAVLNEFHLKVAAQRVAIQLFSDIGLQEKWDALSVIEQTVVQLIGAKHQLYTEANRSWIGVLAGREVSVRTVQLAVAKLERGGWIEKKIDGQYELADPVTSAYIAAMIDYRVSEPV